METDVLMATAREIMAPGKGLLAADESTGTITKRLRAIGVESTEDNRRSYREMLFTAPGIEEYLSGVILFDETIRQDSSYGKPMRELLTEKGIIVGIKVDKGTQALPNFPGEKVTEGLDGLRERFAEYRELGARFAKWRTVTYIGDGRPTWTCVESNAETQARYAALAQEAGLVPIVEPEVLMDGDHDVDRCREVSREAWRIVFERLMNHRVSLEGMILKPNMVLPGQDSSQEVSPEEVAEKTVSLLREVVPAAVPGIAFLSGGQDAVAATERLNAIARVEGSPWRLTFSFSRALQGPVMDAWRGNADNIAEAQRIFVERAQCNSAAVRGQYYPAMDKMAA